MKHLLYLFIVVIFSSCAQQNDNKTSNSKTIVSVDQKYEQIFDTLVTINKSDEPEFLDYVDDSIANELISIYNHLLADTLTRIEYEAELFYSFPSNFHDYKNLFGYVGKKPMPLYSYGFEMVELFYSIESVDKVIRYNKYLDIAFDGVWNADCEQDFIIGDLLKTDTKDFCEEFSKRSDIEIKSILRFVYDGPHPYDPGALKHYTQALDSVKKIDTRIAELMELLTYADLLEENEEHGH
jgi:hypothetical protein